MSSKKDLEAAPLNEQEGYPYDTVFKDRKKKFAQKTVLGELRNPGKFSWVEWAFLLVSIISLLVVAGLNVERFITFNRTFQNLTLVNDPSGDMLICEKWYCTADFILTLCVSINLVFCLLYCLDALFREREFELLAFIGACWAIAIYVVGNIIYSDVKRSRHNTESVKIARLVCVCVFVPMVTVLALVAYRNMGYLVFNVIGSNKKLTRAYHVRSFFETLQYFHVEIMTNIVILAYGGGGGFISLPEKVILFVLLALLIVVSLWGNVAITWELKLGGAVWYIFMLPFLTFYIYKIIEVSLHWSYYKTEYHEETTKNETINETDFISVGVAILIADILGILAVVALSVAMAIIIRNFGLGLKDKSVPPFSKCVKSLKR